MDIFLIDYKLLTIGLVYVIGDVDICYPECSEGTFNLLRINWFSEHK